MPTYGKENFKETNVNYLNKDFGALKESLMNYAKSYFPDTYRDFNETSPGMMLLEMNAYVGDVLSFYIDQQYRELLLPLAEERRNIINLAKMFGYKVKPIVPAFVDLTFTSDVEVSSGDPSKVDYSKAGTFDAGIEITSTANSDITFTTLEHIDFRISASNDTDSIAEFDSSQLASKYKLSRTVKAVSATEKTISFQVGLPVKFRNLIIPDTNVIDIISCVDSNNNNWYEVDFLAQDKVPIQTHYTDDANRDSAYGNSLNDNNSDVAVPFSLQYIKTTKRFTRETNTDNTTSLIFGNGVLKDGQLVDDSFIDMEQVGIVIPGQANDLNQSINPLLGDEYSTLGETPNQTTLTITYRVGGGLDSNVPANDIISAPTSLSPQNGNTDARLSTVVNTNAARGGKDEEDTIEIREKARAFFTTQNRCVTKEDYEARVLNIPAKFGNIAKVYVTRGEASDFFESQIGAANQQLSDLQQTLEDSIQQIIDGAEDDSVIQIVTQLINYLNNDLPQMSNIQFEYVPSDESSGLSTINIYVLGYNNSKQLVGNPYANSLGTKDDLPITLKNNIKKYLDDFRIMTDTVTINDGYIVNFGVIFDVIAEKYADKQKVKFDCIQKIIDYFNISKMQFNQPIFKSQLEFELMGVEGVRSIGHVTLTQKDDYNSESADADLDSATYRYSYDGEGGFEDSSINGGGTIGYGFKYNFQNALSDDGTIVLPPNTATPTVFELKNPNQNIQGRVR